MNLDCWVNRNEIEGRDVVKPQRVCEMKMRGDDSAPGKGIGLEHEIRVKYTLVDLGVEGEGVGE